MHWTIYIYLVSTDSQTRTVFVIPLLGDLIFIWIVITFALPSIDYLDFLSTFHTCSLNVLNVGATLFVSAKQICLRF